MRFRDSVLVLVAIILFASAPPRGARAGCGWSCGGWRLGCRIFAPRCDPAPPCASPAPCCAGRRPAAAKSPAGPSREKAAEAEKDENCNGELCIIEQVAVVEDEEGNCLYATYYAQICGGEKVYYDDTDCDLQNDDCDNCSYCFKPAWYYYKSDLERLENRAVEGKLARMGLRRYGSALKAEKGREQGPPNYVKLITSGRREAKLELRQIEPAKGVIVGVGYEIKKFPPNVKPKKIKLKKSIDHRSYVIDVEIGPNETQRYLVHTIRRPEKP